MAEKIRKCAVAATLSAALLNAAALAAVFFYAPVEASMGEAQKIFYYHVPCAIAAYGLLLLSFVMSIAFLSTGKKEYDEWAFSGVETGMVMIACVLVSGATWGRSAWGKWWVWEPRLTSFLILFMTYLSYLLIRALGTGDPRTPKISAVVSIVAFLNVPLVNRAIAWWGSAVHPARIGLEPPMKHTLLLSSFAVALMAASLLLWRVFSARKAEGTEEGNP